MRLYYASIPLTAFIIIASCQPGKKDETLAKGEEVYIAHCISCHGREGEGIAGKYPPLLKPSGILEVQTQRAIRLIKYGSGFENGMKAIPLTRQEVMEVVNYIQNSWGNEAPLVSTTQIEAITNP